MTVLSHWVKNSPEKKQPQFSVVVRPSVFHLVVDGTCPSIDGRKFPDFQKIQGRALFLTRRSLEIRRTRVVSFITKKYFMKIINVYYVIWSSIIVTFRKKNPELNEKEVNSKLILIISIVNAMNVWIFVFIFKIFRILEMKQLKINVLPLKQLNDSLSFLIQYVLPFIIINYIFIFRKKRYRLLIEKYSTKTKNYGNIYLYSVIIFTTITVLAYGFYSGGIFRIN
jgi:hypothetical protein